MLKQIKAQYNTVKHRQSINLYGLGLMVLMTIAVIIWILYRTITRPLWISFLHPIFLELLNLIEAASVATLVFIWLVLLGRTGRKPPPLPLAPALTVDELYALSPGDFEAYVGQLFQRKGYSVALRGRTGDQGVDVELKNQDGKRAIVQCKRYRTTVGSETVRELFGTLIHEKAAHAFLVTTANVSDAARSWAKNKPITLIDGETLVQIANSLQTEREFIGHPQRPT